MDFSLSGCMGVPLFWATTMWYLLEEGGLWDLMYKKGVEQNQRESLRKEACIPGFSRIVIAPNPTA